MKSLLENAMIHILNKDTEKAEELFHQYMIEKARDIHESLRDDETDEMDTLEEEYFTEEDLMADDDAEENLADDLGEEIPDVADGEDMSDDVITDEGDDMGMADDIDSGDMDDNADLSIEDEMEEFEKDLADLQAKYDSMLAELETDNDLPDEDEVSDGEEEVGTEEETFEDADEDFDDITESVLDELKAVSFQSKEGMGATGDNLMGNKSSLKFDRSKAAKAVGSKGPEHKGFDREAAPASSALKGGKTVSNNKIKNVRKSSTEGNNDAAKEGKKAILRKK